MAYSQMFLLVSLSFAIAFMLDENSVSGEIVELKGGGFLDLDEEMSFPSGAINPINAKPPTLDIPDVPDVPTTAKGPLAFIQEVFAGKAFGVASPLAQTGGALLGGLAWGAVVYGAVLFGAQFFGLDDDQAHSAALAAGVGYGVYTTAAYLAEGVLAKTVAGANLAALAPWLGIGIGAAIFIATYKKEKKEIIRFECLPWEPPLGGSSCGVCNDDPLIPCSEYRCKSLGQACEIVNPGTTEEACVWISKDDTGAPKIEPWEEALKPSGLRYVPDTAISPPNLGFKILRFPEGCLQAFTNLEFGIKTSEPAQCRSSLELTDTFSEMPFLFGETTLFLEEHTQRLKVPNPFAEEDGPVPEIHNNGEYSMYVRCIDANGNGEDSAMVAFSFCVAEGPDTTPPIIMGTSIENGRPVRFNVDQVPIEVYVNEPAFCRWSSQDKAFDIMENDMNCATQSFQINADLNYVCTDTLTGIKNREDNGFFFRCRDYSVDGPNIMAQSFKLTLKGTEDLIITGVGPTGTIEGSASIINAALLVETAHGADEGAATCYYSTIDNDASFIKMHNTGGFAHNQPIPLTAGGYEFFFRCIDGGGNVAETSTSFNVEIDTESAKVSRVLRDGSNLKLITSEEARCAYTFNGCSFNFDEGLPMIYEDPTKRDIHLADWDPKVTYYIKCEDLQGNQPKPDQCDVIVRASEI